MLMLCVLVQVPADPDSLPCSPPMFTLLLLGSHQLTLGHTKVLFPITAKVCAPYTVSL